MVKNDEVFYQVIETNGPDVDNFAGGLIDAEHRTDSGNSVLASDVNAPAAGRADTKQLAQAAH